MRHGARNVTAHTAIGAGRDGGQKLVRVAIALLLAALAAGSVARASAEARATVDAAGRKVELPARIERVYAAGVPASVLLYTLAPDRLLGWPRAPRDEERPFLGRYADLPVLGRLTGRDNTANVEVVLRARVEPRDREDEMAALTTLRSRRRVIA